MSKHYKWPQSYFDFDKMKGKEWAENLVEDKTWLLIKGEHKGDWRPMRVTGIVELDTTTGDIKNG